MAKEATVENANTPSDEQIKAAVSAIEARQAELLKEKMESMSRSKRIRAQMREDYAAAKAEGIRPKLLRKICKERDFERKIGALHDDLEDDEKNEINMLMDKLGDFANLPLGQAAVSRAGAGPRLATTGL